MICATSSSLESPYIEEGARQWLVLPGAEGRLGNPASRLFSFFSLDGGSQWEDTSCTTAPD
jgi:hypothetical protein